MLRRHISLLLVACSLLAAVRTQAFSLLGIRASWMTGEVGYLGGDGGGPMYIGEGYRYNLPVLTYAYDASFLRYFGSNGVAAVDAAMAVLNKLPNADDMSASLDEFPLTALRFNASASALGLIDLKTTALSAMLEQMGVASGERYVWTLRAHFTDAVPREHFSVINLNYDPATWTQSDYVNGVLYSYEIFEYAPGQYTTAPFPVDSSAPLSQSVANYYQFGASSQFNQRNLSVTGVSPGVYYSRLTRDDVAALRYLLLTKNYAVESLLPDVRRSTGSALGVTGGNNDGSLSTSGGGTINSDGTSPWSPVFSLFTALGGSGTSGGTPWTPVLISTNVTTTNGTTVGVTNGLPNVLTALRPGVGALKWVKISYDSVLSAVTQPYVVTWVDRYVTNGVMRLQTVNRSVIAPDMIFGAADLGAASPSAAPVLTRRTTDTSGGYTSFATLNSDDIGGGNELAGPGIANSFKNITFSKAGRYYLHVTPPSPAIGIVIKDDGFLGISWASFSGGTNGIQPYPEGTSLRSIEDLVKRGQ